MMSDPRVPDPAPDPNLPPERPEMPPQPEPIDVPSPVPDNVPPPHEPGGVPPTSPPEIPVTLTIPGKGPAMVHGSLPAAEACHDAGAVHLDIQPVGVEIRCVGAAGLDLADLTGTCGPAGPVSKLQGIWLSHEGSSLIGRTRLLGRSGGRLGRAAGRSNEQQTRRNESLRPAPKTHGLVDA
jgi:hypothetical protein